MRGAATWSPLLLILAPPMLPRALTVLAVLVTPFAAEAQFMDFRGPVSESDMLYMSGDPKLALEILEAHLETNPDDFEALWRAARASVVIGIDVEGSRQQNRWLDPAIDWSDRAVALRPDDVDGRYWRGVATGRRAMNANPSYGAELVLIVYDDAHAILAIDSLHGGGVRLGGRVGGLSDQGEGKGGDGEEEGDDGDGFHGGGCSR